MVLRSSPSLKPSLFRRIHGRNSVLRRDRGASARKAQEKVTAGSIRVFEAASEYEARQLYLVGGPPLNGNKRIEHSYLRRKNAEAPHSTERIFQNARVGPEGEHVFQNLPWEVTLCMQAVAARMSLPLLGENHISACSMQATCIFHRHLCQSVVVVCTNYVGIPCKQKL